jgi:hypothetical protein
VSATLASLDKSIKEMATAIEGTCKPCRVRQVAAWPRRR